MPVIYQLADSDLHSMLNSVMKKYHPRLHEKEVRIDLLLAFSDGGCRAITVGGYPALAKVRIVKLPDRTKGCGDAEIQLDGDQLKKWSRKQTQAILDHELTHLQLKTDKDGYSQDGRSRAAHA